MVIIKYINHFLNTLFIYGCETWATTKGDIAKLYTTERKVLRKIFDPVYNIIETRTYERRYNSNLQSLYGRSNIILYRLAEARG